MTDRSGDAGKWSRRRFVEVFPGVDGVEALWDKKSKWVKRISTDVIVPPLLLVFPTRAEALTPEFCVVSFISFQRLKPETLSGQRRGVRYPI